MKNETATCTVLLAVPPGGGRGPDRAADSRRWLLISVARPSAAVRLCHTNVRYRIARPGYDATAAPATAMHPLALVAEKHEVLLVARLRSMAGVTSKRHR